MVAGAVLSLAPEFAFSQWCWWSKAGGALSLAHRSVSHARCSLVNGRGVAEPLTFPNAWTYACYLQSSLSPRDPVLRSSTPPPRLLPRPFSKLIKPNVAFLSSFLHLPVDFFFPHDCFTDWGEPRYQGNWVCRLCFFSVTWTLCSICSLISGGLFWRRRTFWKF